MRAVTTTPSLTVLAAALTLASCATAPRPTAPTQPQPITFSLQPARFADLPGWASADLGPALTAFRRQCESFARRTPDAPVGANAPYGGTVGQWLPACAAAQTVQPGGERAFFEANFVANFVRSENGLARLTAYYEPMIRVSPLRTPEFSEPLLERPTDMVTVDLGAFADAYDSEVLRGAPRQLTGKLYGDRVRPYPSRSEIAAAPPSRTLAWAHPADVYNLQVQGSGRLQFPDGSVRRAAFSFQNGYRWRSALGRARDLGQIPSASWAEFRRYLDRLDNAGRRAALAEDPSYVFFAEEPIPDPAAGPRGAANVPLTPMGSMAVDPAYHPYGALLYVAASYDNGAFNRLLVAQDTGGAIRRGPLRGDVFFGSGPDAGARAERMNSEPTRFWTLIPNSAGAPIAMADPRSYAAR